MLRGDPIRMHSLAIPAGLLVLACSMLANDVLADPAGSQSGVAINEVNYNPSGTGALAFEYVEVHNPTTTARDLSGWTLRDLDSTAQPELLLAFPPIALTPGCFLLVLPQTAAASFSDDLDCGDGSARIVAPGWDAGRTLANGGDAVSLSDQTSTLQDFVYYDEQDSGDVVADDQAVAEGIWKNGAAIATIAGGIAGRAIALRADGAHPNRVVLIAGAEDLDWVQFTAAQAGTPGARNFPALTVLFRDGFENVAESADLSLALASSDPLPDVGDRITIAVSISNAGADAARDVHAVAPARPGYAIVGFATSSGTFDPVLGTWDVGTVPVGDGTARLLLNLDVSAPAIAQETWVAEVVASSTPDPDSTPGNGDAGEDDRATLGVRALAADLSLSMTPSAFFAPVGTFVSFSIRLTNSGPDAATNVQVDAQLPPGLLRSNAIFPGGTTFVDDVWTVANLPAGATVQLAIDARMEPDGATTYIVEVIASPHFDPDSTPDNSHAGEDDQVQASIART